MYPLASPPGWLLQNERDKMAKRKLARKAKAVEDSGNGTIVTTSRGARVHCLPAQLVIDQVRELYEAKKPDAPTYVVKDVSGAEETRSYNDKTILGPNVPEEDKEAWKKYLTEVAEIDKQYNEHVLRVIAVECVEILDMPPEEEWVKRDKWVYGDVIPDDHDARIYHYFKTRVVGTEKDGHNIMAGIMRASGMDEEVLAQIEASFRGEVEGEDGADTGADEANTEGGEQA